MVKQHHGETHPRPKVALRDVVIGLSDGLTVPFALAAGVSVAVASSKVVVTAGLAEIVAGSISMGLGGYLAARTDYDQYASERRREYREVQLVPHIERDEVRDVFREYGLGGSELEQVVDHIVADPDRWVDFMMRFELGLERPQVSQAPVSALTIAISYAVGGLVPLVPYVVISDVPAALLISIVLTLIALFLFGGYKARMTRTPRLRGAIQTTLIGAAAAAAAFGMARLITG
ncbi:MAG TPA: VIT1/CCC1 transporter family protein [Candidatus Acidoferrales bacterium]|nr:VIT1/CCC1 transporter family protein [Candidatus Acidoferrales bacterium]